MLLHVRNEKASETLGCEADVLLDNNLALALASKGEGAGDSGAGKSLLRRGHAAEVEALQREVGGLGAGGLERRGVVQAVATENVLDGYVGLALGCDAGHGVTNVDHVEAVPDEVLVGADGLQGEDGDGDGDVVELWGYCQLMCCLMWTIVLRN